MNEERMNDFVCVPYAEFQAMSQHSTMFGIIRNVLMDESLPDYDKIHILDNVIGITRIKNALNELKEA